jgi:hypothetical protein
VNASQGTAVLSFLFALRCVLPLLITLTVAYLMNRLVDRWEAEERAKSQHLPDRHQYCPTYKQWGSLCWLARLRREGTLPAECAACPIYHKAIIPA